MYELFTSLLAVSITADEVGLPKSQTSISGLLGGILGIVMILVGAFSVIAIIVGAIQMTISSGDPGKFKTGRQTVTYAVVGLIVAVLAFAIVKFVTGVLA